MENQEGGVNPKMALENIMTQIEENQIDFIRFEFSDMYGIARSKIVPSRHFREKVNGINIPLVHLTMDPQCNLVKCSLFADDIGYADGIWMPDLDTFRVIPWSSNTAEILVEPTFKGKPVSAYPRYIARKQLEKLQELGISLLSAHEHEFYVVHRDTKKPLFDDINLRSTLRNYTDPNLVEDLLTNLYKIGINVEMCDTEYGPGQMEITYKPHLGIRAADNAHVFKATVKEICHRRGYTATFMSKPWTDHSGSSGHFCHSLWDINGKHGLLYEPNNNSMGLSKLGQHWMAGILAHAPAISILMAPTVNCLKRLKPFTFAACNATWGIDNRTCALRLKVNGERGTYIENRMGASGCNPYLSMAAVIAAGVDGIKRELPLPDAIIGNAYDKCTNTSDAAILPDNMRDGVKAFMEDDVIRETFGEDFQKCFVTIKMHEIHAEEEAKKGGDENWEKKMFFDYI
ncbi:lengsin-like [Amphiura filiformis]|uniref:lengsin-like n=1 Tax=Amphiura filiformis TaxID=82378 RepID=UPI003B226A32